MILIYLIFHSIIFGAVKSHAVFDTGNQDSCKDDLCLTQNQTERTIHYEISNPDASLGFNFTNLTNNSSETEINFLPAFDMLHGNPAEKIKLSVDTPEEPTTNKEFLVSYENSDFNLSTTDKMEQNISTEITEFVEFPKREFSSSTVEPKFTKNISTASTAKSKITTTEATNIAAHSIFLQNFKKSKSICFCDVQVNECDINCCCDEDCSPSHFKVFTKCIDNNVLHDSKYCYKNNFIFENNTYHKVIQNSGGLFCIVKQNAEVDLKYKTKEIYTSLESFKKSLQAKVYAFSYKSEDTFDFIKGSYVAGSLVWTVQNGELTPFKIHHTSVGLLCNAEVNIKYLISQAEICFYKQPESQCGVTKAWEMVHQLKAIKIISNPASLNKSELYNSSMICKTNECITIITYLCLYIGNASHCFKASENSKNLKNDCSSALSDIQYKIWHNGTEGIVKMEAYLWIRKLPNSSDDYLLHLKSEVNYVWVDSSMEIWKRSGNPGYITGKPILAGRKVYNTVNETSGKKEAIELSLNPKDWLSVLGSEKGICSSTDRIPINFRENSKYMCSLKLSRFNFSKENCVELQNNIFKLLIGNEIINETKENYFNKFVATFGNSRVEETGDWVQVLIDLFPISSSQVYFKPNHHHVTCKNVITDLYVNIVYSNVGSFLAPQAKILGVSFQFGKHRDLTFQCDTPGCENTAFFRQFKLTTAVHFVDVTEPALDAFAEPLSLEIKLPHDFFYPFFSKGHRSYFLNKYVFILFLSVLFY